MLLCDCTTAVRILRPNVTPHLIAKPLTARFRSLSASPSEFQNVRQPQQYSSKPRNFTNTRALEPPKKRGRLCHRFLHGTNAAAMGICESPIRTPWSNYRVQGSGFFFISYVYSTRYGKTRIGCLQYQISLPLSILASQLR